MGDWHVRLKAWGCESQDLETESICIIHLKVRTVIDSSMEVIHEGMYLNFGKENLGGKIDTGKLSQPLVIREGEKVGVAGGVIKELANIRKGFNVMEFFIQPRMLIKEGVDRAQAVEYEGERTEEEYVKVEIPEGWYSSIRKLREAVNTAIEKTFFDRAQSVIGYWDMVSGRFGEPGYSGRLHTPFFFTEENVYFCDEFLCEDSYVTHLALNNNTFHETRIEMKDSLASILGMPSAFRLRGGGIPDSLRMNVESYQLRLERRQKGIEPKLKTEFPPFLIVSSPIARMGMIGREMSRVLTILESGGEISENGLVRFFPSENNFVSAEPGRYESIECEVINMFDEKSPLSSYVGDYRVDLALIIKSDSLR